MASDGEVAGHINSDSQIELVQIQVNPINKKLRVGMGISYRVHIQNEGWLKWVKNSSDAGSNQNPRIEAIEIKLIELPNTYQIGYQVFVKNKGWTDCVFDSETAGTVGQHLTIEGLRLQLIRVF